MEELEGSAILDEKQFWTLLGMLKSKSVEDRDLAFLCINRFDAKMNLVPMMLLRRGGGLSWERKAQKHYMYHQSISIWNNVTMKEISKHLDKGNVELNKKLYIEFLKEYIIKGFEEFFKKEAEITIKLKDT